MITKQNKKDIGNFLDKCIETYWGEMFDNITLQKIEEDFLENSLDLHVKENENDLEWMTFNVSWQYANV